MFCFSPRLMPKHRPLIMDRSSQLWMDSTMRFTEATQRQQ